VRRRAWTRRPALILAAGLFAVTTGPGREARAESSGILAGLVMSSNEAAVEGAVVSLEGIGSVTSDAAGGFVFRDVPTGNYRLTVSKQGFPHETRLILVQAGRLNKVRIALAGAAPIPPPQAPIGVPIVRQGSAILVRGRVNDQVETLFLVDTGATLCVLTRVTAERLGLTSSPVSSVVTVHTASGSIEAPLILLDLIQVGAAEARSVEAILHDVPGFPSEVGGILGLSFLKRFTVEIDPARGVMVLSR